MAGFRFIRNMKTSHLFLFGSFISGHFACSGGLSPEPKSFGQPNFLMELPSGFEQIEVSKEPNYLLAGALYENGDAKALIELTYNEDWSFSKMSNDEYIQEMANTDLIGSMASLSFEEYKELSRQELFLLGVGKCYSVIYSGILKENGVEIAVITVQFIKNNTLFTLKGSAPPTDFPLYHSLFLKSFDTLEL